MIQRNLRLATVGYYRGMHSVANHAQLKLLPIIEAATTLRTKQAPNHDAITTNDLILLTSFD